jgi:uncharacterized protein involved in oxidation of intracellular sulfur
MAKTLLILNEQPYGGERSYNGLRIAISLLKAQTEEARIFLIGDASACAKAGQKVPQGYYNIADMLGMIVRRGAKIGVCGTCMDARGIGDAELVEGTHRSTMAELAEWVQWADKMVAF